jgi:hypothetical protein
MDESWRPLFVQHKLQGPIEEADSAIVTNVDNPMRTGDFKILNTGLIFDDVFGLMGCNAA